MQSLITRDECRLVQASFLQVEPVAGTVAATFYRRLFELNPALVPLFKTDMETQGIRFMEKLAIVVTGLDDLESIASLVQTLGRGHAGYGVRRADYDTAGEALLWALAEILGPEFNSELRDAWSAAFATVSNEMFRASES
jgi:hemoglobin-like flavoprotein